MPTLRRVLCFGALLLQQGTCQPPAVGLPPTARLATPRLWTLASAGGVIWGALRQWPELLTPQVGGVLGGLDAARRVGLVGFMGPWQLFCFWLGHPLNSLGEVSGKLGFPEAGHQEMRP